MIRIEGLSVTLTAFQLHDVHLEIEKNQFFVLMGPTGAGKTVLLEALAGLVPVSAGRIYIDGQDITGLPPEHRGIGIVYQDYALFPHMTVTENVTYGLHFHHVSAQERKERFENLMDTLNLGRLLGRYPATLSGGELQRVALARALMIHPRVLLLDEPLSALDPAFRREIQDLLRRIHRETRVTMLMVTHDFVEALSLAERAAVINNGRIEQVGAVHDIFRRPRTSFVADFVGMKNVFPALYAGTRARVNALEIELGRRIDAERGYLAIRPEDIVLSPQALSSSMRNCLKARIVGIVDRGFFCEIDLESGATELKSLVTKGSIAELEIEVGREIYASFKATAVHAF
ncbi:MAG: ABC transporter ATP-binding protein [Spirochaetales bacterium]|nr:ABC transporter ATP-binding protein [Spirochaetales bacterium]